jgi:hypothetical protein
MNLPAKLETIPEIGLLPRLRRLFRIRRFLDRVVIRSVDRACPAARFDRRQTKAWVDLNTGRLAYRRILIDLKHASRPPEKYPRLAQLCAFINCRGDDKKVPRVRALDAGKNVEQSMTWPARALVSNVTEQARTTITITAMSYHGKEL